MENRELLTKRYMNLLGRFEVLFSPEPVLEDRLLLIDFKEEVMRWSEDMTEYFKRVLEEKKRLSRPPE